MWQEVADKCGLSVPDLKSGLAPLRDMNIILDHTRSILLTICDGSLPSNSGGGGNLRRIVRRVFSILKHNKWWDKLSFAEFLHIFELHKLDLEELYGPAKEYKSFDMIIEYEYQKWNET